VELSAVRRHATYANVVATLALFVALGGSSYAAIVVTGKNVKDSSLTTKDIKNRSLLKADFKTGQIPAGPRGITGTAGANGAAGAAGAPGAPGAPGGTGGQGAPGVSGYQRVPSAPIANPQNTQKSGTATCPAGKKVLGGGAEAGGLIGQVVYDSYPPTDSSWRVHITNTGFDTTFTVYAICGIVL